MIEYRILHLEDSQSDADLIKRQLQKGDLNFQYYLAENEKQFILGLTEFKPDVILCDHSLPQFNSTMALEIFKEMKLEIPFILVTGNVSEEYAVEMMLNGIDDYLLKTNLQRLPQAIKNAFSKRENEKKIRLAEKQIEFDRNNLRALINNTNDLIWSVDRNFKLIRSNRAFDETIELTSGKLVNRGSDILSPQFSEEQLKKWKKFYERAFSGEVFTEIEHRKTPVEAWSEISFYPIWNGDSVIGTACFSRNITERKMAEEKIRASELQYRTLIEQASDAILILNELEEFKEVNTSASSLLGYSKEEFFKLKPSDFMFIEDISQSPLLFNELKSGKVLRYEGRLRKKNGNTIEVDISGKMMSDRRTLIFIRDITEKKLSQEALHKSETNLRAIFENTDTGFLLIDSGFNIISFNKKINAFIELNFGFELKEKQNLISMLPAGKQIDFFDMFGESFKGHSHSAEKSFPQTDGTIVWYSVSGNSVLDQNGKVVEICLTVNDITERKNFQNKLFFSEMIGQEKERKRLSRDLHDGMGQMLVGAALQLSSAKNLLDKKEYDNLSIKLNEVRLLLKNTIHEVRSISHNMSPHILEELGLVAAMQNVCETISKANNISILFQGDLQKKIAESIEIMLYRIFQELITNIIKHSKSTKATVRLFEKEKEICMIVEDNGIGLNETFKEKTTSGMGLASMKNRVQLLNGNLKITSEAGTGTKIEVSVPFTLPNHQV